MLYEEKLWGKVNELHLRYERQNQYLENLIDMFTQFQNVLYYFGKNLTKALDQNYQLFEEQDSTQNNLLLQLMRNFKCQSEIFNFKYTEIKQNITESKKKIFKKFYELEDEYYNNFLKSKRKYERRKEELDSSEKKYINSVQKAEEKTRKYFESLIKNDNENIINNNEKESENLLTKGKTYENEYNKNIYSTNELRNQYNESQRLYLKNYQNLDNEIGNNIKDAILSYYSYMKQMYEIILRDLNLLYEEITNLDINKDISNLVNNYISDLKPEENIVFVPYKPKTNLNHDSINPFLDFEVIKIMKNKLNNVFPNFNENIEDDKLYLRTILSKLFNKNQILNNEEKLISKGYLYEKENINFFLNSLSNQRKNSKYSRKKEIIEEITMILMEILEIIEKEKDYQNANNCITLSQTFYYEEDNKKIYISNKLKSYHWLKTNEFWKGLIDYIIELEIKRNNENNWNIKNEWDEEQKKIISMVVFSQLVSYIKNMVDFQIEKKNIVKIIEIFIDKYKLNKDLSSQIYEIIETE